MILILFITGITFISTLLYMYLVRKTRIRMKWAIMDNILVILVLSTIVYATRGIIREYFIISIFLTAALIPLAIFTLTMIRFWRVPVRISNAPDQAVLSPADGKVIYIEYIESNSTPISVKKGRISALSELTKTELLNTPCMLIGINMTPFDVHRNSAPVKGKITHFHYFRGKFLSLKSIQSETENERRTYVITNDDLSIGVVQIASRLIRRIDSYVSTGQSVKRGEWIGMIRFGSQVDVIIPVTCEIMVSLDQQVFAGKTIIAKKVI